MSTRFSATLALELLRDDKNLSHNVQQSQAYALRYNPASATTALPPLRRLIELCELQSFLDFDGCLKSQEANGPPCRTDYLYWGITSARDVVEWQRAETEYLYSHLRDFKDLLGELEGKGWPNSAAAFKRAFDRIEGRV